MSIRRFNIRTVILVAIVMIGLAGFVGSFVQQKRTAFKHVTAQNVSFRYPRDYEVQAKRASEGHAEGLLRLKVDDPLSIIELNKEIAAAKPAHILKMNFLDYLDKSAEQNLKYRYPGFKKISSERIKASGRDASLVKFSYLGSDKQTTLYASFFMLPSDNDAFYLFLQSVDEKRWQRDTETIVKSLALS